MNVIQQLEKEQQKDKVPALRAGDTVRVHAKVVEGTRKGEVLEQRLSLSPKAAFRLKKFLTAFGMGDTMDLDVDEETNILIGPDLVGAMLRITEIQHCRSAKSSSQLSGSSGLP